MSDIHIDDFYRDTAKIFCALHSQFPRRMNLYVEDISGPDTPDEFGLHSPRHQACYEAMLWLANTDYIRFEKAVFQEALDQAVLTHRGFLTLHMALPAVEEEDSSLPASVAQEGRLAIHRIQKELKSGTSFSLGDLIHSLMVQSRHFGDTPPVS